MPQEFSRLARLFATVAGFAVLAACGGGGGGLGGGNNTGGQNGGNNGGNNGATVTVSGRVTFDRFDFQPTTGAGLNAANPIESPAREVVVQAVYGGSTTSTTTNANGEYTLTVAASTNMIIRARAQMQKTGSAPTWNFAVRDNTDADAVYVLDTVSFNSGTANVTNKDLKAPSDWNGSGYNAGRRAAPFAILDTVYDAKQLILSAASTAQIPELNLYWSEDNRPSTTFCPDQGNIGTSFYAVGQRDQCTTNGAALPDGIYILGDYQTDTDEYDSHVIAHEFGHFFEDRFSRSDSIGGQHGLGDLLDLRVAFGEGWGNAFGSMALNDPQYRDSHSGISQDFGFNLETGDASNVQGWFSEASVGEFLWDVFDSANAAEPSDNVSLGFTEIYGAMTDTQVTATDALTSIFSFAKALRAQGGVTASAINGLLSQHDIANADEFGSTESNDGSDPTVLPIYRDIVRNMPVAGVCSNSTAGSKDQGEEVIPNKLGNHRFFRFVNDARRLVTITAQGAVAGGGTVAATDPEIYVIRQGNAVLVGDVTGGGVETLDQRQLDAGTYIIDVFDYDTAGVNQPPRCMTLSITGP
ncbi:hypothetical protein ACFPN2_29645 [Steroidobacter flavus]|uniref:Lipoprotein n=1 Tax=Steroidobacter flavus TaxID=1842136 RepID=A0ABV8T1H5_9GAMM